MSDWLMLAPFAILVGLAVFAVADAIVKRTGGTR